MLAIAQKLISKLAGIFHAPRIEQRSNMDEWLDFYRPHFSTEEETYQFVEACENKTYPNNVAKVLMHQAKRLISLSKDINQIRPNDEPLQLLFLIMCVENMAKLQDGYNGEGKSKFYVKKFFNDFISDVDKATLEKSFIDHDDDWLRPLSYEKVVDMLYKIRCDVVHEGNYTDFTFYDGSVELLNFDPNVVAHLTLDDLREIIIRGCIHAVQSKL